MRVIRLVISLLATPAVLVAMDSGPAHAESCIRAGLQGVNAECQWTYADYTASAGSDDGHTWVVSIQCGNGGICSDHVECNEGGEEGYVHDVYMDGTDVGDVCVPMDDVQEVDVAKLVIREFKRIAWPASELVVQPPEGKTLVNFETNFYTLDSEPITKELTIARQRVTLRAVRSTYTFHFGDGTSTQSASPGRPHPNLDVTHVYKHKGDVVVSLDVTYAGEYRIGDGEWTAIPDTLTVAGAEQDLEVVEARPQLVLR
jgi:hypothetical protein